MLSLYKKRRKMRKMLQYLLVVLGFLLIWCTVTITILYLQDAIITPSKPKVKHWNGRSVQVVVGHYNGNLPQEKLRNLTDEEINANNFNPIGWGEGGTAVKLSKEEERLSDETFGINQNSEIGVLDVHMSSCKQSPDIGEKLDALEIRLLQDGRYSPQATTENRILRLVDRLLEYDVESPVSGIQAWFSLYVSDRIALNRTLGDYRKPSCRSKKYRGISELPSTSVIIVYHNEAFSTLLRTVHSVVDRSPRSLLAEIILVDDFSNRKFLKTPTLDDAVRVLPVTVKILRTKQRVGLIRARLMGAQEATGDVLTFLDSHCECTEGWLEPLLDRIKENRKAVVCPVIDVINDRTFQYQKGLDMFRGGFNWNLQFRWYALPNELTKQRLEDSSSPIPSPTMAGGLFSIDRRYFEELGTYDHGMDIWGGENLEISFRIWQCGGRVEILPCSHVGHIFRHVSPHDIPGNSSGKILDGNMIRVSEVWMDEWKFLFYKFAPHTAKLRNTVDLSERIELRRRLQCKSFRWYLENVFTDHHMPMEEDFFGRISVDSKPLCIVNRPGEPGTKKHHLTMAPCTLGFDHWQFWIYSTDLRLKSDEHMCLSAVQAVHENGKWTVQLKECVGYDIELWHYNRQKRTLKHEKSGLCMTQSDSDMEKQDDLMPPVLSPCVRGHPKQIWMLKSIEWRPEKL